MGDRAAELVVGDRQAVQTREQSNVAGHGSLVASTKKVSFVSSRIHGSDSARGVAGDFRPGTAIYRDIRRRRPPGNNGSQNLTVGSGGH